MASPRPAPSTRACCATARCCPRSRSRCSTSSRWWGASGGRWTPRCWCSSSATTSWPAASSPRSPPATATAARSSPGLLRGRPAPPGAGRGEHAEGAAGGPLRPPQRRRRQRGRLPPPHRPGRDVRVRWSAASPSAAGQLERLLYLDADEHAVLRRTGPTPGPQDVVAQYNFGILETLLRHAQAIELLLTDGQGGSPCPAPSAGLQDPRAVNDVEVTLRQAGRRGAAGAPGGAARTPSVSWTRHGRRVARTVVQALERGRRSVARRRGGQVVLRDRRAVLRLTPEVLDLLSPGARAGRRLGRAPRLGRPRRGGGRGRWREAPAGRGGRGRPRAGVCAGCRRPRPGPPGCSSRSASRPRRGRGVRVCAVRSAGPRRPPRRVAPRGPIRGAGALLRGTGGGGPLARRRPAGGRHRRRRPAPVLLRRAPRRRRPPAPPARRRGPVAPLLREVMPGAGPRAALGQRLEQALPLRRASRAAPGGSSGPAPAAPPATPHGRGERLASMCATARLRNHLRSAGTTTRARRAWRSGLGRPRTPPCTPAQRPRSGSLLAFSFQRLSTSVLARRAGVPPAPRC